MDILLDANVIVDAQDTISSDEVAKYLWKGEIHLTGPDGEQVTATSGSVFVEKYSNSSAITWMLEKPTGGMGGELLPPAAGSIPHQVIGAPDKLDSTEFPPSVGIWNDLKKKRFAALYPFSTSPFVKLAHFTGSDCQK